MITSTGDACGEDREPAAAGEVIKILIVRWRILMKKIILLAVLAFVAGCGTAEVPGNYSTNGTYSPTGQPEARF
jgi:hypothetical protein